MVDLLFFPILLLIYSWLADGRDVTITKLEEVKDCERESKPGDRVYIKYTGSIDESSLTGTPNTVFDSNVGKRSPLEFYIGTSLLLLHPYRHHVCTSVFLMLHVAQEEVR